MEHLRRQQQEHLRQMETLWCLPHKQQVPQTGRCLLVLPPLQSLLLVVEEMAVLAAEAPIFIQVVVEELVVESALLAR